MTDFCGKHEHIKKVSRNNNNDICPECYREGILKRSHTRFKNNSSHMSMMKDLFETKNNYFLCLDCSYIFPTIDHSQGLGFGWCPCCKSEEIVTSEEYKVIKEGAFN